MSQTTAGAASVVADNPAHPATAGGPAVGSSAADRAVKRQRVLEILDSSGSDSLLLTSNTALTWYLDGSRVHISLAGDPIAALLVDRAGDHLVTFNNEAARIAAEELPDGVALHSVPWYGNLHEAAAGLGDGAPLAESAVVDELRAARQQLLPGESARYARLCAEVAEMMTDVLSTATPATTEFEVMSRLSAGVVASGAEPLVLLCNGSSRSEFRHPLATHSPLGRRAMAVVCARRNGLIANITRWVRFDASTPRELDAEARIAAVEADIFDATVPGARLDRIFAEIKSAYARHGFGPDQWELHHQGGPAGYAGRDPRVTASATDQVVLNQPFTWNPSGPGVKIEDTVQLTEAGVQVLSVDPRWPVSTVNGLARPVTLQL
ncbi:M24 family metallopeptidase [Pseudarthrobacter sp. J75]|uniref:M24 family metallopeptidase n=1 Tax=unclassified Pseudarthrobacter TaxID=2647000 RepID=UPI002E823C3B|nr:MULTISPECIES: M24 family metallopeptidase [unclassified Pseudarthrobacter]MEE2522237.1 M24 family metallopeptidase [Pseudarthrobacter sp. J47]MEE2528117.1 M24 family metallopeptidase [Pseudarthrobacter sp. J75]